MAAHEAEDPHLRELTIDELARTVGMTVRNVRAYASRSLMPPPRLVGRTGYYGEEHVARLTLVRELLNEGYTLAAVERIVASGLPPSANALAVLSTLRTPFKAEEPEEIIDRETLAARAGGRRDDAVVAELAALHIVELLDDDRLRVLQPGLLAAGVQVVRLGLPTRDVLNVVTSLTEQVRQVADVFVGLFRRSVWRRFVESGMPESQVPEVQSAVENLPPVAVQALLAVFRSAMAEAVDDAIGAELTALSGSADQPADEKATPESE